MTWLKFVGFEFNVNHRQGFYGWTGVCLFQWMLMWQLGAEWYNFFFSVWPVGSYCTVKLPCLEFLPCKFNYANSPWYRHWDQISLSPLRIPKSPWHKIHFSDLFCPIFGCFFFRKMVWCFTDFWGLIGWALVFYGQKGKIGEILEMQL